jgi:hypothetical protein
MTFDLGALIAQLNADPAAKAMLLAALQPEAASPAAEPAPAALAPAPEPVACPPIQDITLLQATLFDNGAKGIRRRYESEYKLTLEVWTNPAEDIRLSEWQWKRSPIVYHPDRIVAKLPTWLHQGSISQEYHDELKDLLDYFTCKRPLNSPWEVYYAPLGDKGTKAGKKGTNYYDRQFAIVSIEDRRPTHGVLYLGGETIPLQFVASDMKGNPLAGKAKGQARVNRCDFYENWGTESEEAE